VVRADDRVEQQVGPERKDAKRKGWEGEQLCRFG